MTVQVQRLVNEIINFYQFVYNGNSFSYFLRMHIRETNVLLLALCCCSIQSIRFCVLIKKHVVRQRPTTMLWFYNRVYPNEIDCPFIRMMNWMHSRVHGLAKSYTFHTCELPQCASVFFVDILYGYWFYFMFFLAKI